MIKAPIEQAIAGNNSLTTCADEAEQKSPKMLSQKAEIANKLASAELEMIINSKSYVSIITNNLFNLYQDRNTLIALWD